MARGRGAPYAQGDEGGHSTRVAMGGTVTAGSGRPPRLSPAYPPFYEPLGAGRGPCPAPPQPRPAGHSPWTTLHRGGGGGAILGAPLLAHRARLAGHSPWTTLHRGGGGGAILGAPLLAHRARLAGPPRTRGRAPGPPPPCPPHGNGAYPLVPGGSALMIRGGPLWRGTGPHPGSTLGSPAASLPGPPATLVRARPPVSGPPGRRLL